MLLGFELVPILLCLGPTFFACRQIARFISLQQRAQGFMHRLDAKASVMRRISREKGPATAKNLRWTSPTTAGFTPDDQQLLDELLTAPGRSLFSSEVTRSDIGDINNQITIVRQFMQGEVNTELRRLAIQAVLALAVSFIIPLAFFSILAIGVGIPLLAGITATGAIYEFAADPDKFGRGIMVAGRSLRKVIQRRKKPRTHKKTCRKWWSKRRSRTAKGKLFKTKKAGCKKKGGKVKKKKTATSGAPKIAKKEAQAKREKIIKTRNTANKHSTKKNASLLKRKVKAKQLKQRKRVERIAKQKQATIKFARKGLSKAIRKKRFASIGEKLNQKQQSHANKGAHSSKSPNEHKKGSAKQITNKVSKHPLSSAASFLSKRAGF